jgi:hypothetical protein
MHTLGHVLLNAHILLVVMKQLGLANAKQAGWDEHSGRDYAFNSMAHCPDIPVVAAGLKPLKIWRKWQSTVSCERV